MRRISFALTTPQFLARIKDVTRREGWLKAKPGEHLLVVSKIMGFKPGETAKKLGIIELVKVSRVPIGDITQEECEREGFPDLTPSEFIAMWSEKSSKGKRKAGDDEQRMVTRLEFKILEVFGG